MSLFKRQISYSTPFAYSKINKEDPEEAIHQRARFLIYKAMEEADHIGSHRARPCFLRMRLSRVKIKIGNRLKSLRKRMLLTISAARAGTCRQVARQFKACKRLFPGRPASTAARLSRSLLI